MICPRAPSARSSGTRPFACTRWMNPSWPRPAPDPVAGQDWLFDDPIARVGHRVMGTGDRGSAVVLDRATLGDMNQVGHVLVASEPRDLDYRDLAGVSGAVHVAADHRLNGLVSGRP